jgi:Icc-related predicted phosphoesterase
MANPPQHSPTDGAPQLRIAAVGDLHVGPETADLWRAALSRVTQDADLLLLAGDLTHLGAREEAEATAKALAGLGVPTFAVLGNHDHHSAQPAAVAALLSAVGVRMLEGEGAVIRVGSTRVGVAGAKGFGGGFHGACGSDFGEAEMKAFIACTRRAAAGLETALRRLEADVKLVLLHYAPIPETLAGERLEIHPFVGRHLLGDAIERAGADLVFHGHAHAGSEEGATASGIPVRNVAHPVIGRPYAVYRLARGGVTRAI